MNQPQIVIHLNRGAIQKVFSSDRDAEIILVDWNVPCPARHAPNVVAVELRGRRVLSRVASLTPQPLHELAGSDLERAVEAAFERGILAEPAC